MHFFNKSNRIYFSDDQIERTIFIADNESRIVMNSMTSYVFFFFIWHVSEICIAISRCHVRGYEPSDLF